MIATIIAAVGFAIAVIGIIIYEKHCFMGLCWSEIIGYSSMALLIAGAFIGLCVGGFGYAWFTDDEKKAGIEEGIRLGSSFAIHEAYKYNEGVRAGDNYFCRFTLRPESDYIVIEEHR